MIHVALFLVAFAICGFFGFAIRSALLNREVPHRWYWGEKNKRFNFATQDQNPIEFWSTVSIMGGLILITLAIAIRASI